MEQETETLESAAPATVDAPALDDDDPVIDYEAELAALENVGTWAEQMRQAGTQDLHESVPAHATSDLAGYDFQADPAFAHEYDVPEHVQADASVALSAAALRGFGFGPMVGNAIIQSTVAPTQNHSGRDYADRDGTRNELRQVWGTDYDGNVAEIKRYISNNLPPEVSDMLHRARLPNGQALLNHAPFVVTILGRARSAPKLPALTGDIERDLAAMSALRAEDPDAFARDPAADLTVRWLYARRIARSKAR